MIFQTETQLKDLGDKLPADKKAPIETALNKLKEAHKAQDIAGIDAAMAELNSVFQAASQEMYNAQNAQGGAQPGPDFGQQAGGNAGNNKQDGGVLNIYFHITPKSDCRLFPTIAFLCSNPKSYQGNIT